MLKWIVLPSSQDIPLSRTYGSKFTAMFRIPRGKRHYTSLTGTTTRHI